MQRVKTSYFLTALVAFAGLATPAAAQMGGGMGGGPSGAGVPNAIERPKFSDVFLENGGFARRELTEGKVVVDVVIEGNRAVDLRHIYEKIQTRKDRIFDNELVIQDVRRLRDMKTFDNVRFSVDPHPDGVIVRFTVSELPLITSVLFHGNKALNERELQGRIGVRKGDALNTFAIENAKRRLVEFYREKGFNQATIETVVGIDGEPNAVVFRVNEGPLERIRSIRIVGATIVDDARLKKIISSRDSWFGLPRYWGNTASLEQLEQDRVKLVEYYRNLGYFEAEVGRQVEYDESGKWLDVVFYVHEGPQYFVDAVQIEGTEFVQKSSIQDRLQLTAGQPFNQTTMRRDVQMIGDVYGELGFLQVDVQPQPALADQPGHLTLVYKIQEGDRFECSELRVNILGDGRTRQRVVLNNVELRPGQIISMPAIRRSQRRLGGTGLFITNPAEGETPRIDVDFDSLLEDASY